MSVVFWFFKYYILIWEFVTLVIILNQLFRDRQYFIKRNFISIAVVFYYGRRGNNIIPVALQFKSFAEQAAGAFYLFAVELKIVMISPVGPYPGGFVDLGQSLF